MSRNALLILTDVFFSSVSFRVGTKNFTGNTYIDMIFFPKGKEQKNAALKYTADNKDYKGVWFTPHARDVEQKLTIAILL